MSTATLHRPKSATANGRSRIAPLRNGEHLSRAEFERRWDATPGLARAELIEGIVFMPPPISDDHGNSHSLLFRYLDRYAEATPGVISRINTSLRLDNRNEYQPDCLLRFKSAKLGRSWVSPDNYIQGAPELIAEVAVSSTDYDAHEKRDVYARIGVQEYLLWQVLDSRLDWWTLQNGQYVPLKSRADGAHRSLVFPGLWFDARSLLAGDEGKVRRMLERGLKSAEHAAFIRKLPAK